MTRDVLFCLLVMVIPLALVMLQPDLGTALVLGAIFLGMLTLSGAPVLWVVSMLAIVGGLSSKLLLSGRRHMQCGIHAEGGLRCGGSVLTGMVSVVTMSCLLKGVKVGYIDPVRGGDVGGLDGILNIGGRLGSRHGGGGRHALVTLSGAVELSLALGGSFRGVRGLFQHRLADFDGEEDRVFLGLVLEVVGIFLV